MVLYGFGGLFIVNSFQDVFEEETSVDELLELIYDDPVIMILQLFLNVKPFIRDVYQGRGKILEGRSQDLHEYIDEIRFIRYVVREGLVFAHTVQALQEHRPEYHLLINSQKFGLVLEIQH